MHCVVHLDLKLYHSGPFKGQLITELPYVQIENTQHKKNDEETHLPNEMKCISTITRTLPAEQLPSWTGQDSDVQIKGNTLSFNNDTFNH